MNKKIQLFQLQKITVNILVPFQFWQKLIVFERICNFKKL